MDRLIEFALLVNVSLFLFWIAFVVVGSGIFAVVAFVANLKKKRDESIRKDTK